jgi:isopentenyl-diphosphate delta-isomerase
MDITTRKRDHIAIALQPTSQFPLRRTGFNDCWFMHEALPEFALEDVEISLEMLGKKLAAPVIISSMTGGPEQGQTINRHLAQAAQKVGVAMGVGSQRITFEHPETVSTFQVRDVAPDILLFSNLGAVQLNYGFGFEQCRQAVEQIGADALYFHLNALQEAVQPEGDTNFRDLLPRMAEICAQLPYPIFAKECGNGLSRRAAEQLSRAGIRGLEVSGAGGTSWALIEGQRATDPLRRRLGETFADWGIPTTLSIRLCREAAPDRVVIASGGIRTGLDAAKAIALGADAISIAQPLLQPALESSEAVERALAQLIQELKVAMFCAGARTLAELRQTPLYT